jgi:FkbM family methyltransferase
VAELIRRGAKSLLAAPYDEVAVIHAALKSNGPGVMVDVGAHYGSSLRPFADDGWQVFALEPDPGNRAILLTRAVRWPKVSVDGRAAAERDDDTVTLYTSDISTGISTLRPFHASHRATARVRTVRLDTYLAGIDEVTVLKTDTEGYDLPVLRTFPWDRLRPKAVVCEFEDRKTLPLGYDYKDLADFLLERGYAVLLSEWHPVVEYGQRHRWRSVRRYPTTLADPRAWGNLLGVEPVLAGMALAHANWASRVRLQGRRAAALLRR